MRLRVCGETIDSQEPPQKLLWLHKAPTTSETVDCANVPDLGFPSLLALPRLHPPRCSCPVHVAFRPLPPPSLCNFLFFPALPILPQPRTPFRISCGAVQFYMCVEAGEKKGRALLSEPRPLGIYTPPVCHSTVRERGASLPDSVDCELGQWVSAASE